MLQHDYLLELIAQFVEVVSSALGRALGSGDLSAAGEVEEAIAGLLDIDPVIALQLSPDSLVTMMVLSGVGDSVAEYVGYALDKVGDAYAAAGRGELAEVRHAQAQAVYGSFGLEEHSVPPELRGLDKQL
ncbi:MAG: hypothetical protein ACFN02_11130 [Olsenella profusa]